MRHPEAGSADVAIKYTKKPFINAGDGPNQHPTQSLLDIYTIKREVEEIDGKTIAFIGDLKYGRTVHSLTYILCLYNPKKIIYISPDELKVPEKYVQMVKDKGIECEEITGLEAKMPEIDVIYMTRIQQERFADPIEYERVKNVYVIKKDMLKHVKPNLAIKHPLPRVNEISTEVDKPKHAIYFQQAANGIPIRQAVMALTLGIAK